jgi:precorrin-6A synthase
MRKLLAIGIGAGNPEHITVQAIKALNRASVIFVLDKGAEKAELQALRRELCKRYIEGGAYRIVELADAARDPTVANYETRVAEWHAQRVELFGRAVMSELDENDTGAILVWGDPSLYDSTLRIIEQLQQKGEPPLEYEVIPGISSPQALAASHKIALNRIGGAVHVTTGRRLAEGWPSDADDVIVMLDGQCAFMTIPDDDIDIYWSAYLGSESELSVSGPLSDKKHEIERLRAEARARKGWIMDTYLLRKRKPSE